MNKRGGFFGGLFLLFLLAFYIFLWFKIPSQMEDMHYQFFDWSTDKLDKTIIKLSKMNTTKLTERLSPADHIKDSQIRVGEDEVVLDIKNAQWSEYLDTNSMDPVLDSGANGIEIIPVNEDEFNIRVDYLDTFYLIPVIPYNIAKETKPLIITKENIILLNSSLGTYFNKNFILEKNSTPKGPFYIKNTLNYAVNGLTFSLTGNLAEIVRLDYAIVGEIKPGETLTQYVWINENKNPSRLDYQGSIELRLDDDLVSAIPMEINFLDEKPLNNITEERSSNLTKPVKNITASDQVKEGKDNLTLLFIILIPLALIVLLYFIFKKDKKKESEDFFKP